MADKITEKRKEVLFIAKCEAERFIERADAALRTLQEASGSFDYDRRATAAAKRASMDLTRALADVRRNPYEAK